MQVQLAKAYEQKRHFENGLYSRKFDGKRMYYLDDTAYSRDNKVCRPAPIEHITQQIMESGILDDYVTDGEVLYFNEDFSEDFKKGISLTSRIARAPECSNLYYVIFDIIDEWAFRTEEPGEDTFAEAYEKLLKYFNAKPLPGRADLLATDYPNILIARQTSDLFEMINHPQYQDWEGLMLRNASVPYEYKRSGNLLKMKRWHTCECKIVGFQEGLGKHEGRLGALIVDYKGHVVSVGSGFNDQEREKIWEDVTNKGKLYEAITHGEAYIKVKYFEESMDAKGDLSLRFPIYQCFRDKNLDEYVI